MTGRPAATGSSTVERARIDVFRVNDALHPYPWRFAVTWRGVRHEFIGIPNQCATRQAAISRARRRAAWLKDGSFGRRYAPAVSIATRPS